MDSRDQTIADLERHLHRLRVDNRRLTEERDEARQERDEAQAQARTWRRVAQFIHEAQQTEEPLSTITDREYEEALRDWLGDRVKFRRGWRHRTSAGGFDAHGIMHHWTAMGRGVSSGTQERLLANGRTGLPGPLCHLSPRRSGIVAVIAGPSANANHAGNGDPDVYAAILAGRFDGTPRPRRDSVDGNERLYGFEYQYHPDDGWMPDEQVEAGILSAAALAEAHGWSPEGAAGSNLDHYEWTTRKIDRERDNLANRTRAGVLTALRDKGDEMPSAEEIAKAVWDHREENRRASGEEQGTMRAGNFLTNLEWNLDRDLGDIIARLDRIEGKLGIKDAEGN